MKCVVCNPEEVNGKLFCTNCLSKENRNNTFERRLFALAMSVVEPKSQSNEIIFNNNLEGGKTHGTQQRNNQ